MQLSRSCQVFDAIKSKRFKGTQNLVEFATEIKVIEQKKDKQIYKNTPLIWAWLQCAVDYMCCSGVMW